MRAAFHPGPSPGELGEQAIHELVRDYPELIPILGGGEVVFQRDGAKPPVRELMASEDLEALLAAVAWRG